jgi:uncharacterized OB-fold protein
MPRPAAVTTPLTQHYWDAAAHGRLLVQRCITCGHHQHYPRTLCTACWSDDLTWVEAKGTGHVATLTVVHMPGHPAWQRETPYVLALVELDEGPRLMTNITGTDPENVYVGMPVRAHLPGSHPDGGPPLVQFTPAHQ